ncbi:MAG: hypothetical protein U9O87_06790 [Verrucomicrobiota bacterium]|nr:hypothetical protein [Verrucomicrobiota bacterium]
MKYKYGNFNNSGDEFNICNPNLPRSFDNFLWNESVFSNVEHTGVGYMDYQINKTEGVKLFTGIGRVCDFDVFGRDGLMSRLIYIRDNDTGKFWTLNWEPVIADYEEYNCTHGLGYTIITNITNRIKAEFRIFIPKGKDPVELWTIKITNPDNIKRNLSLFIYNQLSFKYKWGFNSYGDMLYRNSLFRKDLNAIVAQKHPHTRPHDYLTAFITSDVKVDGFDGSKDSFVGRYNTLNNPKVLLEGNCTGSEGSSDATIGALQYNFTLISEETKTINMMIGATNSPENVKLFRSKYLDSMEGYFQELKGDRQALVRKNFISTEDEHLNRITNIWAKQQMGYGVQWCRWGWNGYRDIVQHAMGVASLMPERTREVIIEAMSYKYSNGMALRGWNPVDEKQYSDSALWLIYTVTDYLKETGDFELLDLVASYYDQGSDTVLAHLEKSLDFLESNKGSHNLILIKFGDWNNSLTAVGKEGRGESVWLSMAYAYALECMMGLFKHIGYASKYEEYSRRRSEMLDAINEHAWDGKWYIRCYDDNGRPIGSNQSEQGKIFLNTQSWAMICGAANKERQKIMLESCDEMLLTDMGYQFLAPTYLKYDDNIGRISTLEPGICENGTIYSHGNAFMIWGLLKVGMLDKAYDIFKRISPGYVKGSEDIKQNCIPYIYSNCHYGPMHRNNAYQMEFSWVTGSISWFYHSIVRLMLGVTPDYDKLNLIPKLPSKWTEKITVDREFRGENYKITIIPSKNGEAKVVCNMN